MEWCGASVGPAGIKRGVPRPPLRTHGCLAPATLTRQRAEDRVAQARAPLGILRIFLAPVRLLSGTTGFGAPARAASGTAEVRQAIRQS